MATPLLRIAPGLTGLTLGLGLLSAAILSELPGPAPTGSYIVQGTDLAAARAAVRAAGGEVTHELGIIQAVGAELSEAQWKTLRDQDGVRRLYQDRDLSTAGATELSGEPGIDTGSPLGGLTTVSARIRTARDDAEEASGTTGAMALYADRLTLGQEGSTTTAGARTVGLRFKTLPVPPGVYITDASIAFESLSAELPSSGSEPAGLWIRGQGSDDAATFSSAAYDISTRARTAAGVYWTPQPTSLGGLVGATTDLSPVVQAIVERDGWASGNAMAFIIEGDGAYSAKSYDKKAKHAPALTIEYAPARGPSTRNTLSSDSAGAISGEAITLTMRLESDQALSDLSPSVVAQTLAGDAAASCVPSAAAPADPVGRRRDPDLGLYHQRAR